MRSVSQTRSSQLFFLLDDLIAELLDCRDDIGDRREIVDLRVPHAQLHSVVVTVRMFFFTKFENLLRQREEICLRFVRIHENRNDGLKGLE